MQSANTLYPLTVTGAKEDSKAPQEEACNKNPATCSSEVFKILKDIQSYRNKIMSRPSRRGLMI